jgi:hypothetical protein
MPLRIAASTRERQPPLAGWNANTVDAARMAKCSNTARWICCSGCAARGLRYDPAIIWHSTIAGQRTDDVRRLLRGNSEAVVTACEWKARASRSGRPAVFSNARKLRISSRPGVACSVSTYVGRAVVGFGVALGYACSVKAVIDVEPPL